MAWFDDLFGEANITPVEKARKEALLRQQMLRNGIEPPPPAAPQAEWNTTQLPPPPPKPNVARSSLTSGPVLPKAMAAVQGLRAEDAPAHVPSAPPIDYLGRQAALDKEYAALNAPQDMSGLQAEGKRRGERGNMDMMLALAAQNAGQDFAPVQQIMLKQAMAARDPLKYSGGMVNEQGDVIEDPGYKMVEQRRMLDLRQAGLDRTQAAAVMQQEKEANQARESQRDRELRASLGQLAASTRLATSPNAGGGKVMSETTTNKIAGMETAHAQLDVLKNTFKPGYERMAPGTGAIENMLGGMVGTDAGNWWSGMQDQQNAALRELSGSAVTANEAARFAAAKINSNLPAAEITRRIGQQQEILALGREKLLKSHEQAGYRTRGFERDTGAGGGLSYGTAPASGGGWSVKVKGQ